MLYPRSSTGARRSQVSRCSWYSRRTYLRSTVRHSMGRIGRYPYHSTAPKPMNTMVTNTGHGSSPKLRQLAGCCDNCRRRQPSARQTVRSNASTSPAWLFQGHLFQPLRLICCRERFRCQASFGVATIELLIVLLNRTNVIIFLLFFSTAAPLHAPPIACLFLLLLPLSYTATICVVILATVELFIVTVPISIIITVKVLELVVLRYVPTYWRE